MQDSGVAAHARSDNTELLQSISSSRASTIDPAWDCAWRRLAFIRAQSLVTWSATRASELHDALELATLCGEQLATDTPTYLHSARSKTQLTPLSMNTIRVHVSPSGNDSADGSVSYPLRTLHAALDRTRALRANSSNSHIRAAILLAGGVYHMSAPLILTEKDSSITITGAAEGKASWRSQENDPVVLSGGVRLEGLVWSTHTRSDKPDVLVAKLTAQQLTSLPHGVPALRVNGRRAHRARYPNANIEIDRFPKGWIPLGDGTEWHSPSFPPYNVPDAKPCDPNHLCGNSTQVIVHVDPSKEWHGMYQDFLLGVGGACAVYDPPLSPWCSPNFYKQRSLPELHTRFPAGMTTHLLPNAPYANPVGAEIHAWRPHHWYTWMWRVGQASFSYKAHATPSIHHPNATRVRSNAHGPDATSAGGDAARPHLHGDIGHDPMSTTAWKSAPSADQAMKLAGRAALRSKSESLKPQNRGRVERRQARSATTGFHVVPSLGAGQSAPALHAQGQLEGVGHRRRLAAAEASVTSTFLFDAGGNQGAEGSDSADEWYIENVFEELDAPGEFYFDSGAGLLYAIFNTTDPPDEVVVPTLATLIEVRGTASCPSTSAKPSRVRDVTIAHLEMRDTRPTYMDPRANPSGGDWSLERSGALLAAGSEDLTVDEVRFTQLDSNAVFFSGYNRRANITHCEFSSLGQSAIASWGFTDNTTTNEALRGDFPRGTSIMHNWCHDIGLLQKQSAFYFQAITAEATIGSNIVFNVPRAGVNFNDGFGGGSKLVNNLMFNTCRESGDHGAFNSWDRLPYITDVRQSGVPSTIPAWNDFERNFIVSNYAADGGCFDNDDGSSYYKLHHNLCVFGGHKSDFDGHSKVSHNNLYIYPTVWHIPACLRELQALPPKGYAEGFYNNTCVMASQNDTYIAIADSACPASLADGTHLGNNSVLVPRGQARVVCGHHIHDAATFVEQGYDPGTTISAHMPTTAEMTNWAKALLGMP